jgi:hypothetical protein
MVTALPTHPHLLHPRTGQPLRAIFVSQKSGRVFWPIIGASEPPEPPTPPTPPEPPAETGYPANTPVAEMTVAQQAAYWKHQSRRHEERAKPFKDVTPEQLSELREKAKRQDELEHELSSETEKQVTAARDTTAKEKDGHYQPLLAETAFRVAIGDRKTDAEIDEFLAELNLGAFLTEGKVNTAKVLARAQQFAPATGNQQQRKGPTVTGHGSNGNSGNDKNVKTGGGSVAEIMAERRAAREAKN